MSFLDHETLKTLFCWCPPQTSQVHRTRHGCIAWRLWGCWNDVAHKRRERCLLKWFPDHNSSQNRKYIHACVPLLCQYFHTHGYCWGISLFESDTRWFCHRLRFVPWRTSIAVHVIEIRLQPLGIHGVDFEGHWRMYQHRHHHHHHHDYHYHHHNHNDHHHAKSFVGDYLLHMCVLQCLIFLSNTCLTCAPHVFCFDAASSTPSLCALLSLLLCQSTQTMRL